MRLAELGHRLTGGLLRDEARTRLWPLPVAALVLAVALGIALPRLDAAVDDGLPSSVTSYLFGGGADAARSLLSALATSLITVTSLTFSLTVVTLQLASSQYSPRLLRTFTRDRFVHRTLAVFLGSFVYALTVLRTVRTSDDSIDEFVPQISVTVAYALTVVSVLALVLFLAHLAQEIRVETILRNVHQDASETLERVLGPAKETTTEGAPAPAVLPAPGPDVAVLTLVAPSSGFIVGSDADGLRDVAVELDAVVVLDRCVGAAVIKGNPVGRAWAAGGGSLSDDDRTRLQDSLSRCIPVQFERSGLHDLGFGLRQITDVAVKALSPGVNDPTTAVHALNHSTALLSEVLQRTVGPQVVRDDAEQVRVGVQRPDFPDLLDLAVSQPGFYGADDRFVMAALIDLLAAAAWTATRSEDRDAILEQLRRVSRLIDDSSMDATDRAHLRGLEQALADTLAQT